MKVVNIILKKCGSECPYYKYDDGGGHCEESTYCTHDDVIKDNKYEILFHTLNLSFGIDSSISPTPNFGTGYTATLYLSSTGTGSAAGASLWDTTTVNSSIPSSSRVNWTAPWGI